MSGVRHAFEQTTLMLLLEQITPTRKFAGNVRITSKYKSILSSIREVGIIEPLVVYLERPSAADGQTRYLLLDGHLRLESLKELGAASALCLISTDDESFTYNRQVSRLSTVQEHLMITRAIDRGVIPERIAAALNVDVRRIHERHRLLEGIVPEVVGLLKDRQVSRGVFPMLRRMKPMRQIEAAEMMVSANLFTRPYAEMLLATTRTEHLINSEKQKPANSISAEDILRMERELDKVNQDHKLAEDTSGENMLALVVAKGYVTRLFRNKSVNDYLKRHYKDLTSELQEVIEAVTADARSVGRE
jgi:ParB-like chromosome segregation protein Spo0J